MTPSDPPDGSGWTPPRRTHPASPWLGLIGVRGAAGLVAVLVLVDQLLLAGAAALYTTVAAAIEWWRRTWSFDGTTITLDEGVLHRTYRRVPVHRVQHVEVNEPFLHRLVGMAVVRVETAGGAGQAEVVLDALRRGEAVRLQQELLSARAAQRAAEAPGVPPPPPPPEHVVLRLSTGRIMLGGVVSSNLLVVFAVMGSLVDFLSRLPRGLAENVESEAGEALTALGLSLAVLTFLGLALVLAALSAVAVHHDLTVVRSGDELRMRRGLFERRDAVVPLARVQSVSVQQNPAQRLLGLASVRIRSAGTGQGGDVRLTVPVASDDEVDTLLAAAVGRPVSRHDLVAAPRPARTRRIVRRLAAAAPVAAAGPLIWGWHPGSAAVAAVAAGGAVVLGLDAYRNLGHRAEPELVVTRWGSILRRTVVVVIDRVQSVRIRSSPLQRRRGLATLLFDLAGRGTTPVVVDQSSAVCHHLDQHVRAPVSADRHPYATLVVRP